MMKIRHNDVAVVGDVIVYNIGCNADPTLVSCLLEHREVYEYLIEEGFIDKKKRYTQLIFKDGKRVVEL